MVPKNQTSFTYSTSGSTCTDNGETTCPQGLTTPHPGTKHTRPHPFHLPQVAHWWYWYPATVQTGSPSYQSHGAIQRESKDQIHWETCVPLENWQAIYFGTHKVLIIHMTTLDKFLCRTNMHRTWQGKETGKEKKLTRIPRSRGELTRDWANKNYHMNDSDRVEEIKDLIGCGHRLNHRHHPSYGAAPGLGAIDKHLLPAQP